MRFRRLIFSFKAIKTLDKANKKAYTAPEFEVMLRTLQKRLSL